MSVPMTLKELRKRRGMTLQELADWCGCCAATLFNTEQGRNVPRAALREKIEAALGADIEWPPITNPGPIPKKKIKDKDDD